MTVMVTVENVIHLDVKTDECTCEKAWCGGVENASLECPEHGHESGPVLPIHSHKRTHRRNVYRGKRVR